MDTDINFQWKAHPQKASCEIKFCNEAAITKGEITLNWLLLSWRKEWSVHFLSVDYYLFTIVFCRLTRLIIFKLFGVVVWTENNKVIWKMYFIQIGPKRITGDIQNYPYQILVSKWDSKWKKKSTQIVSPQNCYSSWSFQISLYFSILHLKSFILCIYTRSKHFIALVCF